MVHLVSVHDEFHARVIAARLGSDGILTEVRPPPGGPYPLLGEVHLYVGEEDVQLATALLRADEDQPTAPSYDMVDDGGAVSSRPFLAPTARLALAVIVLVSLLVLALTRAG